MFHKRRENTAVLISGINGNAVAGSKSPDADTISNTSAATSTTTNNRDDNLGTGGGNVKGGGKKGQLIKSTGSSVANTDQKNTTDSNDGNGKTVVDSDRNGGVNSNGRNSQGGNSDNNSSQETNMSSGTNNSSNAAMTSGIATNGGDNGGKETASIANQEGPATSSPIPDTDSPGHRCSPFPQDCPTRCVTVTSDSCVLCTCNKNGDYDVTSFFLRLGGV